MSGRSVRGEKARAGREHLQRNHGGLLLDATDTTEPGKFGYSKEVECYFTAPDTVQTLYKMMQDVHELFEQKGVDYWVEFGTLLGAVRHKGLAPWDDDLDIMVPDTHIPNIRGMVNALKELGYGLIDQSTIPSVSMFRIYDLKGTPVTAWKGPSYNVDLRFPYMDIDLVKRVKVGTQEYVVGHMDDPADQSRISYYHSLKWSQVAPRRKYPFGPMEVWGPSMGDEWLQEGYGHDYMTVGKMHTHDPAKSSCTRIADTFPIPSNPEPARYETTSPSY